MKKKRYKRMHSCFMARDWLYKRDIPQAQVRSGMCVLRAREKKQRSFSIFVLTRFARLETSMFYSYDAGYIQKKRTYR